MGNETKIKLKDNKIIMKNSKNRALFTRYYSKGIKSHFGKGPRKKVEVKSEKSEFEDSPIQSSDDSIQMDNLFLLKLPDKTTLIFYNNGRKAISSSSNGYIAVFDNTEKNNIIGYGTPSGDFSISKESNILMILNNTNGMISKPKINESESKKVTWKWKKTQMDPKEFEINKSLKVRMSVNKTAGNVQKPNYVLFFAEKEDSFMIQLSNSKRKPLLSKLGC